MSFAKKGAEVKVMSGRHAGKFGQIERRWSWLCDKKTVTGFRIIIHSECRGDGPKLVSLAESEIQIVSAVDLLAQKAS